MTIFNTFAHLPIFCCAANYVIWRYVTLNSEASFLGIDVMTRDTAWAGIVTGQLVCCATLGICWEAKTPFSV
jgi:hypothetical protein